MENKNKYNMLDEYIRQGEPAQKEKAENWNVAIGLQKVDGLTPSDYLIETAKANIEGKITIDEAKARITSYYKAKPVRDENDRTDEADKVSAEIAKILSEKTFSLTPLEYISIHNRLFTGVYKHAGKIRDYNISKDEWVLGGESVYYANALNLRETLEYDFSREKEFSYKGLTKEQTIEHIVRFIADLWQIHIFGEGNTRTTAVFLIKYLRKLGFKTVTNDLFAANSWYFRNALVRANYEDLSNGINATHKYLRMFFGNLLLGENNELKNREMLIDLVKGNNEPVKSAIDPVNDPENELETIVSLISDNPKITIKQIADKLGCSHATAKRRMNVLKENGTIERVGGDKGGYWKLVTGVK
jgi:fido (protein-threonine AMPylation protein)